MRTTFWLAVVATACAPLVAHAQVGTASSQTGRAWTLAGLQQAAVDADPRARQTGLISAQSDLRTRTIAASRRPSVTVESQLQLQSDVALVPLRQPNGQPAFSPAKDTYDTSLRIGQRLWDATIPAQQALEQAQRQEQLARVTATVFAVRQEVNDTFFAVVSLQTRAGAIEAASLDLEARLRDTEARVRAGVALQSESAAVEAALLQRRQDLEEVQAGRRVALARLVRLTGIPVGEVDTLVLPELAPATTAAATTATTARTRPEYAVFDRMRDRLSSQRQLAFAQERPTLSAYGRAGYGRPGLNFVSRDFDSYALGGIQLQWRAWNWGTAAREREVLSLQAEIVAADEAAFSRSVANGTEADLAAITRLEKALGLDDRIAALREGIERATRARFDEGVVTAAEYVDRNTELLQARLVRAAHVVELAQARARLLTTLGLGVH